MEETIRKVHETGGVEVMKASAGSGKTFSLAREYIRLLMTPDKDGRRNERAYRHILAVTFTNKATGEMKARIISELEHLNAAPEKSGYKDYLMEECGFKTTDELKKCAGKLLSAILNDYGSFSVSTIDKFFQTTLRAFSREIGQFSEYQIELDKDALVSEGEIDGHKCIAIEILPQPQAFAGKTDQEIYEYMQNLVDSVNKTMPSTHRISKMTVRKEDFKRTGSMKVARI